jgi:hypothetical protein
MSDLIITPRTKVLHLIEAYPQLEEVLIQYVPTFSKLKNPLLRNTVAKITSLQQAASIGNVKVEDLINHLRKEVSQDLYTGQLSASYTTQKPAWFSEALIEQEFNVTEMLAAGEQPVNQVIADLNNLSKNKIYKLIAPFLTAPLIDKASSLNIEHWIEKISDEEFNIYFYKEA